MCSLLLTHPWGAVGSRSAAPRDQLQILSQYLGQGYWMEIDLYTCFDGGGNCSTQRKPMWTRGEHANSTPSRESNPGLSCYEATVLNTTLPCRPTPRVDYLTTFRLTLVTFTNAEVSKLSNCGEYKICDEVIHKTFSSNLQILRW